ncbi:MAG: substrate-binding domain-containing protein [Magnetococcales bacterium]|nr:substrate-binding domain-containing protein [Magnetococcales bacterium]MBF0149446.1 substrate-binding domain-containing protein [Magnetococcales bacterium]MBF0171891.1 substrate-binding domain-containing protein [Magnetococcales bacterium]
MNSSFIRFGLCSLLLLFPAMNRAMAEHPVPNILKGTAFSNPEEITKQSEEWLQQPIRYQARDQGVDVALLLDQNIYPGLLPLVENFAKENNIKVSVREGTCGPAAEGVMRKEVDIGGSCCPAAKIDRPPGLQWHTVGISPMAILVNGSDPVDRLTSEQVRDIFRGKLTRWSQIPKVGNKFSEELLIRPITRLHCKTRPGHWRLILDNEELFGPRINEVGTILDMVISVARNRGSLGYLENWKILNDPKYKDSVKIINIDGYAPNDANAVASGHYPFYWVYNVSTWTSPNTQNPKAQQLVSYLMDHADRIDPALNLVPSTELRKHGWKFKDDELVGEP